MQTLGLSDSTPKPERRLKALLWPTIRNEYDFDYITQQAFWVCFIVAISTLILGFVIKAFIAAMFDFAFYLLGGIGVRQRSRAAAVTTFAAYLLSGIVGQRYTGSGFGVVRIIFLALLFSNVRGAWLSSRWKAKLDPADLPVRLNQTVFDKLSDQLPSRVWPFAKWIFGFFAAIEICFLFIALFAPQPPSR